MAKIVRRRRDGKLFKASYPPEWKTLEGSAAGDAVIGIMGRAQPFYFIPVEKAPWWQFWRRYQPTGGEPWTDAGPADFDVVR